MSFEMYCLVEVFGYGWSDLVCFIVNVMKFVFILFDQWLVIIDEVIKLWFVVFMGYSE